MVSIKYNSDLSSQSKNIVIFVSSISQLKNLKIPINLSFLYSRWSEMQNIGISKFRSSIYAAQFMQRFIVNNTTWVHLGLAGVSWAIKDGKNLFSKLHSPGATVFGVRLIDQFLKGK